MVSRGGGSQGDGGWRLLANLLVQNQTACLLEPSVWCEDLACSVMKGVALQFPWHGPEFSLWNSRCGEK